MKRTFFYTILIISFLIAVAYSLYCYRQAQIYDEKMLEVISEDSPLPKYHFALIGEEMDHDYWRLVGAGAKKAALDNDVFVEYEGPKRSNPEEQLKLLDMAIQAKVDGIIVQALNDTFTPLINKAVQEGIPVITIDTDAPESLRNAYIGTDNYLAGQLAGQTLVKDTGGKAKVGIITGGIDNAYNQHQLRVQGFKDAIAKVKGIKIIAIDESNLTRVQAEEKAYKMLKEHEDITAFYGTSSLDGIGIVAAAKSLKKQDDLYVISFDALDENIDLLNEGNINAIIAQQPFEMGEKSIELILNLIKQKSVPMVNHTNASIVHRKDLEAVVEKKVKAYD
ncbi:sugar-binding protein [Niallia sp. FSL W8-0635]|uniref:sugar-binding protein n=1 Tax=Niallia sp. FSL W8-0635 TaxID=2975337 RepID=UPI0009CFBD4A|nr:ribose ABC transporter periplasmic binding protein [Mycobacteroides abscessus subsp. abscessus]